MKVFLIGIALLLAPFSSNGIENVLYQDIDDELNSPQLLYLGATKFPIKARKKNLCGWVDLSLDVSAKGEVSKPIVVDSSSSIFEKMSLRAIRKSYFSPTMDEAGNNIAHKGKKVRLVYTHREGCPEGEERDPKINPFIASHCMKIISSDPTGEVADYYVKNNCGHPIEAVACVGFDRKGISYCKTNYIEPKKRGYIKYGFVYSNAGGKVSKYGLGCRVENEDDRRLIGVRLNKMRGTLLGRCRAD